MKRWKYTEKQIRRHLPGRYVCYCPSRSAAGIDTTYSTRHIRQFNKRELWRLVMNWKEEDTFQNSHMNDALYHYW